MPTAPLAVCLAPGCRARVPRGFCAHHARTSSRNHGGVSRQARGYDRAYERARAALLGQPCHWCGRPADSADHLIPTSQGGTLADLVPACHACNFGRGARLRGASKGAGAPR